MFDLVQERDIGPKIGSRTMVYVVSHGEPENLFSNELSEKGKNQVYELVRSRMIAGISRIYSSNEKIAEETAEILGNEFGTSVIKQDCLKDAKIGNKELDPDILSLFWSDPQSEIKNGENIEEAQHRFGECLNKLVEKHQNDSFAIVTHPMIATLFNTYVVGGIPQIEDWIYSGYSSCASYEVTRKSWSLVMPPDDSFLTEPCSVVEFLPAEIKEKFGI